MISNLIKSVDRTIDPRLKRNLMLRALSSARVPLLFLCSPTIVKLDDTEAVVKIPLQFTTKNHVGSMYFGALSMGAELSVALPVVFEIFEKKKPLNFLFTKFNCEFLKKAKEDIYFVFDQIGEQQRAIGEILEKGGSQTILGQGKAFLKSDFQTRSTPVIQYQIGINVKNTKK